MTTLDQLDTIPTNEAILLDETDDDDEPTVEDDDKTAKAKVRVNISVDKDSCCEVVFDGFQSRVSLNLG